MKLEIKHLAPYLPHGLKGICTDDLQGVEIMNGLKKESTYCIEVITDKEPMDLDYFKPILFPLSSLTNEITINGKKIKIIDKIKILTDKNHFEYILRFLDVDSYEILPYWVMELLFSYKIDVFGLIELGLAEPVTEDFNPYK